VTLRIWIAALLLVLPAYADRGSIPFVPNVEIFEPSQKAFLAWNGEEEILVLSTDLRASKPTKVLELMPLPSEPAVKKGDIEVFRKATGLINRKMQTAGARNGARSGPPAAGAGAGEITFHEKIGAHDVRVVRVNDSKGFVRWVNAYLKSSGVDTPVIPKGLKKTVDQYLREGFKWFVFDVVALDEKAKTNDAIQYRFKTDSLFYPLKISRSDVGNTTIDLLVLTPKVLSDFRGIAINKVSVRHRPVPLTAREVRFLSKDCDQLLQRREGATLRIWQLGGDLASFKQDLIAR
jgi:hypothetical protein